MTRIQDHTWCCSNIKFLSSFLNAFAKSLFFFELQTSNQQSTDQHQSILWNALTDIPLLYFPMCARFPRCALCCVPLPPSQYCPWLIPCFYVWASITVLLRRLSFHAKHCLPKMLAPLLYLLSQEWEYHARCSLFYSENSTYIWVASAI